MANSKKYVSLDKLGLYDEKIKKVITDADAAALQSAKDYVDDSLKLYETAGTAATEAGKVQAELDKEVTRAKAREDEIAGLVATAQGEVDALEGVVAGKAAQTDLDALAGKVGNVPEGQNVMGIIANIQENAYDDTQLRGEIDAALALKADKTQVATDIADAVKVEKEAREAAIQEVQGAVNTLSGTHATDKAALEGAIALKADKTELEAVSAVANAAVKQSDYDTKVAALEAEDARIAGLVATEQARAEGVEAGLDERLEKVEVFFELAEGEKLDEAKDTLIEIQKLIDEDAAAADQMVKDIAANKKAIEDHAATNHDFATADATLKAELEGKINGKVAQGDFDAVEGRVDVAEGKIEVVEGKVSTLEGEMDGVQAAVATKAEAQALADAVSALEGADAGLAGRIQALEAKHGDGEGTVESMIEAAKEAAIDAAAKDAADKDAVVLSEAQKYADAEVAKDRARLDAVEAASATHALASDLTALGNRVTPLESDMAQAKSDIDAVESLAAANESAIKALQAASATHALQTDLEAISGKVTALETWHENFVEVSEQEVLDLFK